MTTFEFARTKLLNKKKKHSRLAQIVGATEEVEDEEIIEHEGTSTTIGHHFLQTADGTLVKVEDAEIDFEDNIIYR